jgi:phage-related minor tail protein
MNQAQLKAMGASYGRSVLAGVVALYTAGITDPKDMWAALVAALVPVVLRAANPKDPAFGKFDAIAKDVDDAMKNIKPVKKKVAKKAAKKVVK